MRLRGTAGLLAPDRIPPYITDLVGEVGDETTPGIVIARRSGVRAAEARGARRMNHG